MYTQDLLHTETEDCNLDLNIFIFQPNSAEIKHEIKTDNSNSKAQNTVISELKQFVDESLHPQK